MAPPSEKPSLEKPTKVPVDCLQLDFQNPRLAEPARRHSEEALIAQLYRSAELDELLQSMSSNGYLDIEPLVVMQERSSGKLVVLEGNRRLAAIRLLTEADLVSRIRRDEGLRLTVPRISQDHRSTFDHVTVYRVSDRDRARPLLGFKHINGPHKWNAYSKARFAATWHRTSNVGLTRIASSIGDRHDTIKRMVSGIYVLDQATEMGLFGVEDRYSKKFNFSHLYTALPRSQYRKYLGLQDGWARSEPTPNPIPSKKKGNLREVIRWIYGSKSDDVSPVIKRQNPDIKRLGEVLENPESVHILQATKNLDRAHRATQSVDSRFRGSLIKARTALQSAAGAIRGYDRADDSLLDVMCDIKEIAELLHSRMKQKRSGVQ